MLIPKAHKLLHLKAGKQIQASLFTLLLSQSESEETKCFSKPCRDHQDNVKRKQIQPTACKDSNW